MKYHPPRQSWIGERDFELYRNVVSMAYQFHDEMLGTLLEKAGEDTTVILMSDHGFHPDHLRPASIPDIPAGPAIEHRDFGILAISGPGIKKGEPLHGASVLDIAPTILTLYGLPVGEDMDGKVLSQAFVNAPKVAFIPSWEEVPGADGRHPPHTRLDPVAAHEALEQMIALGYIERPDEDREVAVEKTIRELRYNLGEAYQDGGRHIEAHGIFTELCAADPDEQRFAVRLFVSCQALGMRQEMRRIVDDLDGRRRALFEEAKTRLEALRGDEHLNDGERRELARWRNLARYQPAVADYLKAQVLTAEGRYADALAALERVTGGHLVRSTGGHLVRPTGGHLVRSTGGHLVRSTEGHLVRPTEGRLERPTEGRLARPTEGQRVRPTEGRLARPTEGQRVRPAEGHLVRPTEGQRVQPADGHLAQPGLFLQTADLYLRLRRWGEARQIYETVLAIDPDSADAHLGMSRVALRRRKFSVAAHSALDALQRVYHDPSAHFLLGLALSGMKEYERAAEAFRAAISFNPNFPEAHLRLASVLEKHLGDPESARAHRRLARRMKSPHGDGSALQSTRNSQAFSPAGLRCAGEFLKSAKGAGRTPKPAQEPIAPRSVLREFPGSVKGAPKPAQEPIAPHSVLREFLGSGAAPAAQGSVEAAAAASTLRGTSLAAQTAEVTPPLEASLIVVTGLPRSGTSMLMQMLAAGGMGVLSDGRREADEDNPRGYFEFEQVKNLLPAKNQDAKWLFEARGRAIKIVAPLLAALPPDLPCRAILIERDLDEVLDSQQRMLLRRNRPPHNRAAPAMPQRRLMLKEEYTRTLGRVKAMLARRPGTQLLVLEHGDTISDPLLAAGKVNKFLGGGLDVVKMAAAVAPNLHRNRAGISS